MRDDRSGARDRISLSDLPRALVTLPPHELPQRVLPIDPSPAAAGKNLVTKTAMPADLEPLTPASRRTPNIGKLVVLTILSLIGLFVFVDYVRLRIKLANPQTASVSTPAPSASPISAAPATLGVSQPKPAVTTAPLSPAPADEKHEPVMSAAPPPPPPPKPAPPPPPHAQLASLHPVKHAAIAGHEVTDLAVGDAIRHGVDFLASQFSTTRLKNADNWDPDTFAGLNACAFTRCCMPGRQSTTIDSLQPGR